MGDVKKSQTRVSTKVGMRPPKQVAAAKPQRTMKPMKGY